MKQNEKGFTLVELLIVVAIIAILAGIALPNLLTALNRSKQRRTMADIRSLAAAWEARATDLGRYNAAGAGIDGISTPLDTNAVGRALSPTYIKQAPVKDGWARPFYLYADAAMNSTPSARYCIVSAGADGSLEGSYTQGPFSRFDCDIVYSNGTFLTYPEGVQSSQ